jgi:hypothetical protein
MVIISLLTKLKQQVKFFCVATLVKYALFSTLSKYFVLNKIADGKFKFYCCESTKLANPGHGQDFYVTIYPNEIITTMFGAGSGHDTIIFGHTSLLNFVKDRALYNAEMYVKRPPLSELMEVRNTEYSTNEQEFYYNNIKQKYNVKYENIKNDINNYINNSLKLKLISWLVGI